jgi:phosphoglycolate phosphatase
MQTMNTNNPIRAVLFDLDGTLVDHFPAICRCQNQILAEFGHAQLSFPDLKKRNGPPLATVAAGLLRTDDPALIEKFCGRYRKIMAETYRDGLTPMPNLDWLLASLREKGVKMAIFTNKQQLQAERVCRAMGIDRYVQTIVGTEEKIDGLRKPDPKFTAKVLVALGAKSESTAMVGDSDIDMATGALSHLCATYGVTTGTHSAEELYGRPYAPTAIFGSLGELGKKIFGL